MKATRGLVFLFCFLLLAIGHQRAGAADPQIEKEVKEFTEKFLNAYETKDLAQLMTLFAQDNSVVVLDNSPSGRHIGPTEIKTAFEREFAETAKVKMKSQWISADRQGDVTWFSCELTANLDSPEEKLTIPVRWSGVLSKRDGKWLLVLTHFSFVSPDIEETKPK
jgi:uncharacterized protein (TIGR02246 family)